MIIDCIECHEPFFREPTESWKKKCMGCWKRSKGVSTIKPDSELRKNIRALIQLCHPDHHAGSELSVKMTRWLLELKERA